MHQQPLATPSCCIKRTDLPVQRVLHDSGREELEGEFLCPYQEHSIQREPTPEYNPECNGLAERHNLSFLDMASPMLADSGDQRLGFGSVGQEICRGCDYLPI
jgi:hypothetical protein